MDTLVRDFISPRDESPRDESRGEMNDISTIIVLQRPTMRFHFIETLLLMPNLLVCSSNLCSSYVCSSYVCSSQVCSS